MTKFVKIDIFAGRPNPVFAASEDLLSFLHGAGVAVTTDEGDESTGKLGYRGFRVLETISEIESNSVTSEDLIGEYNQSRLIESSPDLERRLLDAAKEASAIDDQLYGYIADAIGGSTLDTGIAIDTATDESRQSNASPPGGTGSQSVASTSSGDPQCPPCGGADAPGYNPGYWNGDSHRKASNNCYAYANNQATNTFPQPGRGSGQVFTFIDCDDVRLAAERDGLVTVGSFQASRAGWYVALVIWPGQDYHWYRQDTVGCWSHKPGSTSVRNLDNGGAQISDPQLCDRGPYSIFCTYMVTDASAIIS